jgi:hypothetical protein
MYLPLLQKSFLLALCGIGIYSLFSAVITMVRLRASQRGEMADTQRSLMALHKRNAKLRQVIGAAFYVFGLVFFLGLQMAYLSADTSRVPVERLVLENLLIHFAFAANVFFVFLILHVLQWFVSAQVVACESRLNSQSVA